MRLSTFSHALLSASLLSLVVALSAVPVHGQNAAKGAALLKEARNAIGGDGRVATVKRLQLKGVVRRIAGATNIEGDFEIAIELPDKFRRDETLSFGPGAPSLERTEALNGADSWEETSGGNGRGAGFLFGRPGGGGRRLGGGGRRDTPPDAADRGQRQSPSPEDLERLRANQLQNRRADFGRLLVAFLLTTDAPVTWIGTAQSPDGTADVLEIAPAGEPASRLFLDPDSHLPLMMSWAAGVPRAGGRRGGPRGGDQGGQPEGPSPSGALLSPAAEQQQGGRAPQDRPRGGRPGGAFQPATFDMHFSEYRAVNGIKFPHLITRAINGETNEEIEISTYRVNPNLKSDTFTSTK